MTHLAYDVHVLSKVKRCHHELWYSAESWVLLDLHTSANVWNTEYSAHATWGPIIINLELSNDF